MKKTCFTLSICLLVLALLPQVVIAKDPTTPNVSVIYAIEAIAAKLPALASNQQVSKQELLPEPVRATFQTLFDVNQNLAMEVGRLPAFQKELKEKDALALTRFTKLVGLATPEQKNNLEALLSIGLKEFRRYSAPLEAIFWVLEKGDYDQNKQLLQLPLQEVLDQSWDFSDKTRWGAYETVTDRLNAPELVNYYQRIRFVYESKAPKGSDAFTGDARGIFERNMGNCYDHTEFAVYCLGKADYKTSSFGVHPVKPSYHVVSGYEANGKSYYLDNGRPDRFLRRGIIPREEYEMYREKAARF